MFIMRAGVFTGRLPAILSRDGLSVRPARLRRRAIRRLCVETVHVLMIARRIVSRERKGDTVFSTLSKGPIRAAIWRAACGLTTFGTNPGSAVPNLGVVASVAASAESISLFLDCWSPSRICSSQLLIASPADMSL